MSNHAEDIAREHEEGRARAKGRRDEQTRAAQRIQALLATAEDAAKRGDLTTRDQAMQRATALQLKYVIDDALLASHGEAAQETVDHEDFCQESNTPLIKAKRQLIAALAELYRGRAIMMGDWKPGKEGQPKGWDRRAKVRVFAHTNDLKFIRQMYLSLLLQMQTEMAKDERDVIAHTATAKVPNAWRVSYAHAWVTRVYNRLLDQKRRQEADQETGTPGSALVLRDRGAVVTAAVNEAFSKLHTRKMKVANTNAEGRAAGDAAGRRADLGNTRVAASHVGALPQ